MYENVCVVGEVHVQGEDMKRNPEMGETAIQPVPAQTADLSISGLSFMSSRRTSMVVCHSILKSVIRNNILFMPQRDSMISPFMMEWQQYNSHIMSFTWQ